MEIEKKVEEILKPVIENAGYILDQVLYLKEDGNKFLRIVIDKNEVVTLDDCVEVTKIINPILDEADLIDEQYILDVCSKEKGSE